MISSFGKIAITLLSCLPLLAEAFIVRDEIWRIPTSLGVSRYGPPLTPQNELNDDENDIKEKFRNLLEEAFAVSDPNHLPRILTQNIEMIVSMKGEAGAAVISEFVEEAKTEGQDRFHAAVRLVETILSFAEDFVDEATNMDSQNKYLLGKIIKVIASKDALAREREELLDQLMEEEKENFTPGFLRHIEGECERISNAPKVTPESSRLLEILSIIQTRVLEEIGKDMGEAAVVLGQLIGYDDLDELKGVLEAGFTVRGRDFAVEMSLLAEEALDGFKRIPNVDSGLIERVSFIEGRLREYLDETNEFQ